MARILIIDDDEALLFTLERWLAAAGHVVAAAADGLEAAKLFRAMPFELIVTDLVMPNREGLETIIMLRREFPEVRVIAMSGGTAGTKIYLELAARLGAHNTLEKPFTPDQLNTAVTLTLGRVEP